MSSIIIITIKLITLKLSKSVTVSVISPDKSLETVKTPSNPLRLPRANNNHCVTFLVLIFCHKMKVFATINIKCYQSLTVVININEFIINIYALVKNIQKIL